MIRFITFADEKMSISAMKLHEDATRWGYTSSIYGTVNLDGNFRSMHAKSLTESYRYGWYCWKPYVVLDAILELDDGDYLIYCDAGNRLVNNFDAVIRQMESEAQDIFLFTNGFRHIEWCKMDAAEAINPFRTNPNYFDQKQVQASTILLKVNQHTRDFIQEWYAWSLMPGLIDNSPSKIPNVPTFAEHRWDQALLTCLAIKYNIPQHWFPSTTNMHQINAHDAYPAILDHHRRRNVDWHQ